MAEARRVIVRHDRDCISMQMCCDIDDVAQKLWDEVRYLREFVGLGMPSEVADASD